MLLRLVARIHSWWVCRGTHDWTPMRPFVFDPDGPDVRTFPDFPEPVRGRWEKYNACRRCGLRDDGKGYDE